MSKFLNCTTYHLNVIMYVSLYLNILLFFQEQQDKWILKLYILTKLIRCMHTLFQFKKWKHFYIIMERKSVLIKSKAIHLLVTYLTPGIYAAILRKPFSELLQRHFLQWIRLRQISTTSSVSEFKFLIQLHVQIITC